MKYFTPLFQLATLAPPQSQLRPKIGGIPWGLPPHLWPTCCNHPQKLLAQLPHHPPILDLGHPNAVLHLFQCLVCCGAFDEGRTAFLTDRSLLTNALTTVPGYDDEPNLGTHLIGEAFIENWQEQKDNIPPSRLPDFLNHAAFQSLRKEFPFLQLPNFRQMTKFGGVPYWTVNGPHSFPKPPFEFLFQLHSDLYIDGPPPNPDDAGCTVTSYTYQDDRCIDTKEALPHPDNHPLNAPWYIQHDTRNNHYSFRFTNLALDGTLFVFINRTTHPHQVQWFLNR